MLAKIALTNFKLHKSTEIEARPVTIFIGPNNSGKSSIFQALLLLRQCVSSGVGVLTNPVPRQPTNENQAFLYDAKHLLDPGEFQDILHPGQREITLAITGKLFDTDPKYGGSREIRINVGFRDNQAFYQEGSLSFDARAEVVGQHRTLGWNWSRGTMPAQVNAGLFGQNFHFVAVDFPQMLQAQGFSSVGPPSNNPARGAELSLFQNRLAETPKALLKSVHPIYALRGLEESGYPVTLGPESSIDRTMLADRTLALLSVLAYRNDVLDHVSNWLENLIQVRVRTKLVPPRRLTIICEPVAQRSRRTGLFSNEGTGASQLPFILLPIALCPLEETMIISEPEAHLHPRLQSELARLLIQISSSEKKQLLIETHSEHVLNTMLQAVAKSQLRIEDIAIYYFEQRDGVSAVKPLVIDVNGRVQGGLPGFFDQSLAELTEYLETIKNK